MFKMKQSYQHRPENTESSCPMKVSMLIRMKVDVLNLKPDRYG